MIRVFIGCLLAAVPVLAAQQSPPAGQPEVVFRTETNLALVRFHVVKKGKYAEDIGPEDIGLFEDGAPQKLAFFEGPGQSGKRTLPIEIILLFDGSLSVMNNNLLDSYAIRDTVLKGIDGNVGVSVYAFGRSLKRFTHDTRDPKALNQALDEVYKFSQSATRLYESIMQVCKDATDAGGPNVTRVMVIFSDGQSTTKEKPMNAAKVASHYGVSLYPVILGHDRAIRQARNRGNYGGMNGPGPIGPGGGGRGMGGGGRGMGGGGGFGQNPQQTQAQAQREGRLREKESYMQEFAAIGPPTGGRSFDPPQINNMIVKTILEALVGSIRSEYVAGFYMPAASGEQKQAHKLEVKLVSKSKGRLSGGERTIVR